MYCYMRDHRVTKNGDHRLTFRWNDGRRQSIMWSSRVLASNRSSHTPRDPPEEESADGSKKWQQGGRQGCDCRSWADPWCCWKQSVARSRWGPWQPGCDQPQEGKPGQTMEGQPAGALINSVVQPHCLVLWIYCSSEEVQMRTVGRII